jgi:hypothetical protein
MVLVVAACSSSSSGPSADEAAEKYSSALCERIQACSPTLQKIAYGDSATCKTFLKRSALAALAAPSTGITAAAGIACADKLPTLSCPDLFDTKLPPECAPIKGALATGAACGDGSQCVSTFCAKASEATCGSCAIPPTAGQACANGDCPSGLKCVDATCQPPGVAGATCDAKVPCGSAYSCFNGKCQAGSKLGEACDPKLKTAPGCDVLGAGAVCQNGATCEAITYGAAGDTCGFIVNGAGTGKFVACPAPTYCAKKAADPTGICSARAIEGAGCKSEDDGGPTCVEGLKCEGGICKFADPKNCK